MINSDHIQFPNKKKYFFSFILCAMNIYMLKKSETFQLSQRHSKALVMNEMLMFTMTYRLYDVIRSDRL